MTNEELIAQAREFLRQRDFDLRVIMRIHPKGTLMYGEAEKNLSLMTTHLAEMEEHEKNRFIDPTSYGEKWICKVCGKDCPCNFLITKAKQLLGVE